MHEFVFHQGGRIGKRGREFRTLGAFGAGLLVNRKQQEKARTLNEDLVKNGGVSVGWFWSGFDLVLKSLAADSCKIMGGKIMARFIILPFMILRGVFRFMTLGSLTRRGGRQ